MTGSAIMGFAHIYMQERQKFANRGWIRTAALFVVVALAGCGKTVTQDRPVRIAVPVAQPCALARPAPVPSLESQTPDWSDLDVRQKAAWVSKQALALRTYGEQLNAATAACKEN